MTDVVALQRVHARDAAAPKGRARGVLIEASLFLGKGAHAVLGAPEDGTLALMDVVTGRRPPSRGRVLIEGREPSRSVLVRARIGSLTAEPELPPAPTVEASVSLCVRARGEPEGAVGKVFEALDLGGLRKRSPRSLSYAEARAVDLALALTTPSAALVVLHEPLSEVAVPSLGRVAERVRELCETGACVLVLTSSPADARALANEVFVLQKGLFLRRAEDGEALALEEGVELTAWVRGPEDKGPGVRELAAALAEERAVKAVSWEAAPTSSAGSASVRVKASDVAEGALALTEAALRSGVEIEAIARSQPLLGEVRAATDTLMRLRASAAKAPAPAPLEPPKPPPAAPMIEAPSPVVEAVTTHEPPPEPPAENGGTS